MSDSLSFDRAAAYYDETRAFPPGVAEQAAALMAEVGGLDLTQTVLEVGVGTGRIALPLTAHVRAVVGVDLSRAMMARLVAKWRGERVYLGQADAVRLPFAAGRFPAAIAVHVFHLIPAWREALADLARVLEPEGVLLSAWTEGDDTYQPVWDAYRAAIAPRHGQQRGARYEDRGAFLAETAWRLIRDERFVYVDAQPPALLLDRLERRVWSRSWTVSDAELAAGVAAARAAALAHFGDLDRPVASQITFRVQAARPPRV